MLRSHRITIVAVLALALALPACAQLAQPKTTPASQTARPAAPPAAGSGLDAQAAWLKGSAVKLTPIEGAAKWLGSGLRAFRDADGAECVYDPKRDAVLSWEPGVRTVSSTADSWKPDGYGVTVGAAAAFADVAAAKVHKGDLAALRRTVQLDDNGNGAIYAFQYDAYVNGVRVPDHVTVDCAGNTGAAGFTAFYTKPAGAAEKFQPRLALPDAAAKAAAALKLTGWRFVSAELYLEPMADEKTAPKVVWAIGVAAESDSTARYAIVDPLTGEASATE